MHTLTNHSQALLDGFLERTAYRHHLAHTLHARSQLVIHTMELRQVPTRNLAYHIVESRFEECTRGLGDRVLQIKQAISQAQFGCNKSQRITRSL